MSRPPDQQTHATTRRAGYAHPRYTESLAEFGVPLDLPHCGGSVLLRPLPGGGGTDAMGPYPLFACSDWSALDQDLAELGKRAVCLSLVADPITAPDEAALHRLFPDRVVPFKRHFRVDLQREPASYVHPHHQRNARWAQARLETRFHDDPPATLTDWSRLYAILCQRHGIRGMRAFSPRSFAQQLQIPGLLAQQALYEGNVVGMLLWLVQGDVAYYHLGAYSDEGYRLKASFALFAAAMEGFPRPVRWLSLGSGAGLSAEGDDGLTRFKRGWATDSKIAYFCGRIFQPERYAAASQASGNAGSAYFPAYRAGEFT